MATQDTHDLGTRSWLSLPSERILSPAPRAANQNSEATTVEGAHCAPPNQLACGVKAYVPPAL